MKSRKKNAVRRNSGRVLATSLTIGAVIAASRPAILSKVYAAANEYEWTKQVDHNLLGGQYTSSAISADGSHLIVGSTDGGEGYNQASPLYVSGNAGTSWENVSEVADERMRNWWTSVDVSNDGQTMVAASERTMNLDNLSDGDGKIFVSVNGGDSWEDITPADLSSWSSVVVSGNGNKIVALSDEDTQNAHITTNGGDSWQTKALPDVNAWESLSISDNGNKVLVGGENDDLDQFVYLSTNGGTNWTDIAPNPDDDGFITRTAMSATGDKIAVSSYSHAGDYYDKVQTSTNNGANWTDVTPESDGANQWRSLAMSDDGARLSVADDNDKMFLSINGGASWTEEDPGQTGNDTNTWRSADFNANGSRMVTVSAENAYVSGLDDVAPLNTNTVDFNNAEGGAAIKLTTPDGTTITCHSSVKESVLSVQDAGYKYPLGLVDFCFDTTEESNDVTLTFVTDLKPDDVVARKYNPDTEKYDNVDGVTITETTYEGKQALQVTYTIVDNGSLDMDPDVGEIADPVGLAEALGTPNTGLSRANSWLFTHPKK